jgi:hypothetical protein
MQDEPERGPRFQGEMSMKRSCFPQQAPGFHHKMSLKDLAMLGSERQRDSIGKLNFGGDSPVC